MFKEFLSLCLSFALGLPCASCGRIGFEALTDDDGGSGTADAVATADASSSPSVSLLGVTQLGGSGYDVCYSLAMNARGRHAIAARFSDTANLVNEDFVSEGGTDIFVASWDADGDHLDTTTFGDSSSQGGNGVEINDADEILLVGDMRGAVNFGGAPLSSAGDNDWFAVKLEPDGVHQWSFTGGSPDAEFAHDARIAGDGSGVIVGNLGGQGMLDGLSLDWKGGRDAVIVRFGPAGNVLWRRVLGSPGNDDATGVAITPAGDVVAGGSFSDSVDFGDGMPRSATGRAAFVTSMDDQGDYRWVAVIDGPGDEYVYGMNRDEAGNVYVAGSYQTGATIEGQELPPGDLSSGFVASFTSDGTLRWVNTAGGDDVDVFHDVAVGAGEVFVVGYFMGTNSLFPDAPQPPLFRDGLVLSADLNTGEYRWTRRMGETTIVGIGTDGNGLLAVSGYFGSTADFGDGVTRETRGDRDVFVARLRSQ